MAVSPWDGEEPDPQIAREALDYAFHIVKGVGQGLYGFGATVHHIITRPHDVIIGISQLAFDATIIAAAHMPPQFVASVDELKSVRQSMRNTSLYRDAAERMNHRWTAIQASGQGWAEATGPQRAGMATNVVTQVFLAPALVVKTAVKISQLATQFAGTGGRVSGFPTYRMPSAAESAYNPPPFRPLTVEQLRARHTPAAGRGPGPDVSYPYVVLESGQMVIADPMVRLAANQNIIQVMFTDAALLAAGERVFAAGKLTISGATGNLISINNNTVWRFVEQLSGPSATVFENLMRRILPHNGFGEAILDLIRPGAGLPAVNFQGAMPRAIGNNVVPIVLAQAAAAADAGLGRLGGAAAEAIGGAAAEGTAAAEGVAAAAERAAGWRLGAAAAAATADAAAEAAAGIAEAAEHGHHIMHHMRHAAELAVETGRVGHHANEHHHNAAEGHHNAPIAPPPRQVSQAAAHAAAAHVHHVAQQVMNQNMFMAKRNEYYLSLQSKPLLQPLFSPFSLPSNQRQLGSGPSSWDAERYLKSFMYSETSVSSLQMKLKSYGYDISASTIRSVIDSSSGITRCGDHFISHLGLSSTSFAHLLSSVRLTQFYNSLHDVKFNSLLRQFGVIGGVATGRGTLEGDIAQINLLHVLLSGKEQPFSDEEIRRILGELKKAIFDTSNRAYLFFSLHFNNDAHLYPVLHPCYQDTLAGKVIAMLDYYLKCVLNGVFYQKESFLERWHEQRNSDPAYLRAHVSRERLQGCPSLHELMLDEGFENEMEWTEKVRISFRIIAEQGPPLQDGSVLRINPRFKVEYTIDRSPKYQEEIESYRKRYGRYPEDYLKLEAVCSRYAEIVHEEMPKIPIVKKYFKMLEVLSFVSYYYDSLKAIDKRPVVDVPPPYPNFPKALPPLPRRFYRSFNLQFTFQRILQGLSHADLNQFFYLSFMKGRAEAAKMKEATYRSMHAIVSQQVGSSDLDRKRVEKLSNKYFFHLLQFSKRQADALISQLVNNHNRRLQLLLPYDSPLIKELACTPEELAKRANGEDKLRYLKQKQKEAMQGIYRHDELERQKAIMEGRAEIAADRAEKAREADQKMAGNPSLRALFEIRLNQVSQQENAALNASIEARRADLHIKLQKVNRQWDDAIVAVERRLQTLSELINEETLLEPIEENYRHGVVDFPTPEEERNQIRVVGGCGMVFAPLTPVQVAHNEQLTTAANAISLQGFTRITHEGATYQAFAIASESHYELEEEEKGPEEDDQKLLAKQGMTQLMIDGLQGDDQQFTASLAKGNPATRLPNELDLLRMMIQNGNELRALQILKSSKLRDLDHFTEGDVTALHMALECQLLDVAERLVQMGADCTLPRFLDGYTALHVAVHHGYIRIIDAMKARGVNINLPLPNGKSALHLAAEEGHDKAFLDQLIARGARLELEDNEGNTALQCAIRAGRFETALYLAEVTPIGQRNKKDQLASMVAARYGMFPVMDLLIERGEGALRVNSPIFFQFDQAHRNAADYIMKLGALQSFGRYRQQAGGTDVFRSKNRLEKAAHHGLLFHALIKSKRLVYGDPQRVELLIKMIKLDDSHAVYRLYRRQESYPTYHCLAAEWGSRGVAQALQYDMDREAASVMLSAIKGGDAEIFSLYWKKLEREICAEKDMPMDAEGNRLVHYAVHYGRVAILKKLYRFGHNMDIPNNKGITPYQLAAKHEDKKIMALLKEYGVVEKKPVEEAAKQSRDGYECGKQDVQLLMDALQEGNLAMWKKAIHNRNALLFDGHPPLHYLLQLNASYQEEFALQAMEALGWPYTINKEYEPVSFTLLKCENRAEVEKKIEWLKKAYPNHYRSILAETNSKGEDLCDRAIQTGRRYVLDAMRAHSFSKKAFHYACMGGDLAVLQYLIQMHKQNRSAAERFDEQYNTPMHLAASFGYTDIVQELLTWGVNPRLKNRQGELPLVVAIRSKQKDVADLLFDELGDTLIEGDLGDREGRTPFIWAVMQDNVALMSRFPRDKMYETDNKGLTALHLAAVHGSIKAIKQLLAWGVDIHLGDVAKGKSTEEGLTPLHYAAKQGQIEAFLLLLEKGAELERVSNMGTTVAECMVASNSEVMVHQMVQRGLFLQQGIQQKLVKQAIGAGNLLALQQLYLMGVPLDDYDDKGMPAIYTAVICSRHEIVKFLLSKGCSITQQMANGDNRTLFSFAKDIEMRKILESYVGFEDLPPFPSPLPTWSPARKALPGTPIPPQIKRGLSVQECTLIERYPGTYEADYYTMARRIKKEIGLDKFVLLFIYKTSSKNMTSLDVQELMHQLLTIEESIKSKKDDAKTKLMSKERIALRAALDHAWTLKSDEMRADVKKHYNAVMEERNVSRTPEEMVALFRTTNDFVQQPLSLQAAEKIAADFHTVLNDRETCTYLSQEELARIAKSHDPLEAMAAIRETIIRVLRVYPYDTQLFAALSLIGNPKGRIGQMQTGEGKSTVILMVAAFYASRGKNVDIITTTHSLAKRDHKKFKEVYRALGITSSHIAMEDPEDFSAKVIFGTQTDFEFALLRERLDRKPEVVLVDEVDGLVVDVALNNARIAMLDEQDLSWLFVPYLGWIKSHDQFDAEAVRALLSDVNRNATALLTDQKLESLFHQGKRALKRIQNVDYVVKKEEVVIVDYENTGSLHKGSRWSGGLHEFIEAIHEEDGVKIHPSTITMASISHIAFFKRYPIMLGLTGTLGARQEREELEALYDAELFDIPTHFPSQRQNLGTRLIYNDKDYYNHIISSLEIRQRKSRPVLILVQTIDDSLKLSQQLHEANIKHRCLNAVQQEGEAYLLEKGADFHGVTVATSFAGRGTDFVLPFGSQAVGGLHVMLCFFAYNERVERQGIGRAARQGQEGSYERVIHMDSPFVQELLKMHPPGKSVTIEDLETYRSIRVGLLSQMRRAQAGISLLHNDLFEQFSKMRRQVEKSLNGPERAECKRKLTKLWAEFFSEIEHLPISRASCEQRYEQFLSNKVKVLPYFANLEEKKDDDN